MCRTCTSQDLAPRELFIVEGGDGGGEGNKTDELQDDGQGDCQYVYMLVLRNTRICAYLGGGSCSLEICTPLKCCPITKAVVSWVNTVCLFTGTLAECFHVIQNGLDPIVLALKDKRY